MKEHKAEAYEALQKVENSFNTKYKEVQENDPKSVWHLSLEFGMGLK